MSGPTKDTVQKILLIALSAMTVSLVLISIFNYNDNQQKNAYLDNEKELVQEELLQIIKNYDHLAKQRMSNKQEVTAEKLKAVELLENLRHTILDYESIIDYRTKMLELRKNNHRLQRKLNAGMSSEALQSSF